MNRRICLGIVVSESSAKITDKMLEEAVEHAKSLDAEVTYVCRVPGCFDMPLMIRELLGREDVEAVITLGSIVKETSLEEYIFNQLARKITDLSLHYGKPVSLGVSGPGIYWEQEVARAGAEAYAKMAVEAAVKMAKRIDLLRGTKPSSYPLEVK